MAQSASLQYQNAFVNPAAFAQAGNHQHHPSQRNPPFPPTSAAAAAGSTTFAPATSASPVPAGGFGVAATGLVAYPSSGPPPPNSSNAYFYNGQTPQAQASSLAAPPASSTSNQLPPSQEAFQGLPIGSYHGGSVSMGSVDPTMMPANAYTSGPYNQSTSAFVPPHQLRFPDQQLQQQGQAPLSSTHSATPPQPRLSPNAGPSQTRQHQQHTPPTKHPMAAPPLPQSPANANSYTSAPPVTGSTQAIASPSTPQSPGLQGLEQQRIALLLDINVELLQEVNRLQAAGHGGAISAQQAAQLRNEGKPDTMASEEYINCLRRVQANLAYLMPRASAGDQSKAPLGPGFMTPPAHMVQLQSFYDRLRELFPNWQGLEARMASTNSSPRTSVGGGGGAGPGPVSGRNTGS